MMTREEFGILVKAMKAVYSDPKFIPDKDAFEVFYMLLHDLDYQQATYAVYKYMSIAKKPPTIADLREYALSIIAPELEDLTELEAWGLVRKAICNSNYHASEEFRNLPEVCQRAVGSPANLREWAMMGSSEIETVEQSHFIRNYRAIKDKMRNEYKVPSSLLEGIEAFRIRKGIRCGNENPMLLVQP